MQNKIIYLCDKDECKEDGDRIDLNNGLYDEDIIVRCREHRPDKKERFEFLERKIYIAQSRL